MVHDGPAFSLIYNFRNPPKWRQPWAERYRAMLDQIAWIDRELPGITGIKLTEHHFYDDGYLPSPFTMAGAVAACTDRVTVGTNLIQLPLHHPIRVAEDSLVLDVLSGGRFTLGVGMGYAQEEFAGLGVGLRDRAGRFVEAISILRSAFRGAPVDHEGRHFQVRDVQVTPPPIRPGGPPIWLGAMVPRAIERAARLADGFFALGADAAVAYFDACDRLGRPRDQQLVDRTYWTLISEDPERTLDEVGHNMLHRLNEYIVRGAFPGVTEPYDDPRKAVADGRCLLLDGPAAVEEFNAAIEQGAVGITITPVMPGERLDGAAERIRYLADHVIPHVRRPERSPVTA